MRGLVYAFSGVCLLILLVAGFAFYRAMNFFGPHMESRCNYNIISKFSNLNQNGFIEIIDILCDDGFASTHDYKVEFMTNLSDNMNQLELMFQWAYEMQSNPPKVEIVSSDFVKITAQKKYVQRVGPAKVGKIRIQYVIE